VENRITYLLSSDPEFHQAVMACSRAIPHLQVEVCPTVESVRRSLPNEEAALLLVHLEAGSLQAENEFVRLAGDAAHWLQTVVFSNHYDNRQAVRFLRAGAVSYLGLPVESHSLNFLMDALTLQARYGRPKSSNPTSGPSVRDTPYLAIDPDFGGLSKKVRRVAAGDTTILLTGETGTGKTLLARLIHKLSPRRDQPFQVIDCGALSSNLIESEMFGHVKGAFTGADRDRVGKFSAVGTGTLFLDEVNSLPSELQCKLLRAVDDCIFEPVGSNKVLPMQARLIAASNRKLDQEVADGRFRADLYYRLNVVDFHLPPLRERRPTIPPAINRFLAEFAQRHDLDVIRIHPEAMRLLCEYDWPGNLRELRNVIESAASLCSSDVIQPADLAEVVQMQKKTSLAAPHNLVRSSFGGTMPRHGNLKEAGEEAEMECIIDALAKNDNNRFRAAQDLGISRMSLYKKLHKYGLMDFA
jgi:DNA-binding NtrC family response regulator